jgi:uncharacterized protein (TIGR04255 family)
MTTSQNDLPDFSNPPVVEVALSLMFEGVGITSVHMGALWQLRFRTNFPTTQDQPPLDLPEEAERERHVIQPQQVIQVLSVPTVRTWFLNASGTELIQLQRDRFTHNWRRGETNEPYPRYRNVRGSFESELEQFREFLQEQHLGELKPKQCEVTYVNHIYREGVWESHGELDKVFRFWAPLQGKFLPPAADGRFFVRYVIRDDAGAFAGRLHISVQPAFRGTGPDEQPMVVAALTARGRPLSEGIRGALDFLELGHEWIVRGFTDVTTDEMHRAWGRQK